MKIKTKPNMIECSFKARYVGDRRDWRNIPELCSLLYFPHDDAQAKAKEMAKTLSNFPNVVEIRYSFDDGSQGFYVPGSRESQEAHRSS